MEIINQTDIENRLQSHPNWRMECNEIVFEHDFRDFIKAFGFMASLVLTYDKIQILQDPDYNPGCNISPILSCGSVMNSDQADVFFGIPNSIFGLVGYTSLITTGVVLLAGAKLKRWYWLAMQAAATVGVVFVHYLFFQSMFVLNTICPWCFVVWMVTIPIFWYVTLYNLRTRNIPVSKKWHGVEGFLQRYHGEILTSWILILLVIMLNRFWYYWETLI